MPFTEPRIDLLTSGEPSLDSKAAVREFSRSIRPMLRQSDLATKLHWRCREGQLHLTLGTHQLTAKPLARSYWGEEAGGEGPAENDLWEYGPRAAWMERDGVDDTEGLEDLIIEAKGAILLEAVETSDRQQAVLLLCHLAASLMDENCVAMIVPTSGALHPVTQHLCEELHERVRFKHVLQYVLRTDMPPDEEFEHYWYVVYGLQVFGLPEVGMRFSEADQDPNSPGTPLERAGITVQSVVAYLLDRGEPVPPGDTIAVGGGETLRVGAATFPLYGGQSIGGIDLLPGE